jgi:hypothetical protein
MTGTLAGVDRYPPGAHARSALRPVTGDLAYALMRATEELLQQRERDGAAKHWVVAVTTEAGVIEPRWPSTVTAVAQEGPRPAAGSAFDVRYQHYDGPERVKAGADFRAIVEVVNAGWDEWRSEGAHPVRVSCHWLTPDGEMVEFDGLRSDLPRLVGPGDTCRTFVRPRASRVRCLCARD